MNKFKNIFVPLYEQFTNMELFILYLIGGIVFYGLIFHLAKVMRKNNIENGWSTKEADKIYCAKIIFGSIFYPLFLPLVISFYTWKIIFKIIENIIKIPRRIVMFFTYKPNNCKCEFFPLPKIL